MVEHVTFQTLFQFLQTVGILVGVFYYIMTIRTNQRNQEIAQKSQDNALETRQAQLFMQLYAQFTSKEFRVMDQEIRNWAFTDLADFIEKYGDRTNPEAYVKFYSVTAFYEGIGVLIYRNLINSVLVDDMMSGPILELWGKFGPMILEMRERFNVPTAYEYVEYLYYEIKKIVESQHGTEVANRFETNW